ncbi:MAG: VanZ family protein [Saprospiraceae bacterium]|nr:VanZ family protein [Saprospiraceae bacterium]
MNKYYLILKRWGPAILVMSLIFIASSIPSEKMPNMGPNDLLFKKGGHMSGYALLFITIYHGLGGNEKSHLFLALVGSFVFALSDEFHQSFVAGRNATMVDVGIDMIGSTVCMGMVRYFRRMRQWMWKH